MQATAKEDKLARFDVFPDIVVGWMLLMKTGLEATERVAVTSAAGGLAWRGIEDALRKQWSDDNIRARDARKPKGGQHHAHAVFYGADSASWDEDLEEEEASWWGDASDQWTDGADWDDWGESE